MADLDRQVAELNASVPAGVATLPTAEMQSRGLDRFSRDAPSIVAQTQLYDHVGRQIWPPSKPVWSTTIAIPIVRHPGPNWHEALEAAAAERREEWEKVIADHERRAKEQKERKEKELTARIAEDRQDRRNR